MAIARRPTAANMTERSSARNWQVGSEVNNTAAVNADLAGPEVDNLTVPIWFQW